MNTTSESVWQWRDCRIVLVPNVPRGSSWWPTLWEQASNIMRTAHPVPHGPEQRYQATLGELVRKGLTREAHLWAQRKAAATRRAAA